MIASDYVYIKSMQTNQGYKIGNYLLTKTLGSGSFSKVWLAVDQVSKKVYAAKQIKKITIDQSKDLKKLLQNETAIMNKINHPNILHLHEQYVSENNYYLFMDFCNQGDLENYMDDNKIDSFDEKEAVRLLRQLMNGFVELRKYKILHRDLKLANIYMHNHNLVIGDFGFAKIGSDYSKTQLGTPITMAPELLFPAKGTVSYNSKADLWSVGVVFYQMLFGKLPFFGKNKDQLKDDIVKHSDKNLTIPKKVSDETLDLLYRLLAFYPKSRIEWTDFFNHPIFKKFPDSSKNTLTASEFMTNSTNFTNEEVKFYDEVEFAKLNMPNIEKNAREEQINDSAEIGIINNTLSKEVFFRYSHQMNKTYFLVFAARKIGEIIKQRSFPEIDNNLLNVTILILLKGITMNKILLETLKTSENYLQLTSGPFELFLKSEHKQKIEILANDLNVSMKKHVSTWFQRVSQNRKNFQYDSLVNSGKVSLGNIDSYLTQELSTIKGVKIPKLDDSNLRDYYLIFVLLNYALNGAQLFRYCSFESKNPKYNWGAFYYTIERSNANELKVLF